MATQPPITAFFRSKKRRATDVLEREAKLHKGDPTLVKFGPLKSEEIIPTKYQPFQKPVQKFVKPVVDPEARKKDEQCISKPQLNDSVDKNTNNDDHVKSNGKLKEEVDGENMREDATTKLEQTTPRKGGVDSRSFMTKSPYRPECKSETPVKYFRMESKAKENETTPAKMRTPGSIIKPQGRPHSAVKKSIHFEDEAPIGENKTEESAVEETDDIIKAANDLVEKLKNKQKTLGDIGKVKPSKKHEVMTAGKLKQKLARTAKLAELKSSLSRLGQQASELMKIEKKKAELSEPKIRKFDTIEVEVPLSPHKGALASPAKSPAKPAYERFAHLIHRTAPSSSCLPLPMGFQKLLDMFTATDTVCSMLFNRGEIITFKKLKPAVLELVRTNLTERHLAQMAAVLPDAFEFRQEKLRNFGSTSKVDRYELVVVPKVATQNSGSMDKPSETANLITAADCKKMTPKMLQLRKDAFLKNLLERTIDKHDEFLQSLDPPITIVRSQLTRWHPNFPLDLVPDVPPASLPEPPHLANAPTSAKDVLEKAKKILDANIRMKNALEAVSQSGEFTQPPDKPQLSAEAKAAIDKRVAAHDPLKGISKSLLEKIRAKQAAKALEAMKVTPADELELAILSKLPDAARIIRGLFVDHQKGVLPMETVVEKAMFSAKRSSSKIEVETTIRRLITELPDWLNVFTIRNVEYLKLDRTAAFGPITEKLEKKLAEKRRALMY